MRRSPVQVTVLLTSWSWISNGPIADLMDPGFSTNPVHRTTTHVLFVPVTVTGWYALFHLITGLIGVASARQRKSVIRFAIACGAFYLTAATSGLIAGSTSCGLMAVDTVGDIVHIAKA